MTDTSKFPPDVSKLFEPRHPLNYVEQIDTPPQERRTAYITGISSYLDKLREYKETEYPKDEIIDTPRLQQQRAKKEKQLQNKKKLDEDFAQWNPQEDPHIKGDPYKTLFIARLGFDVTEIDLQKEFSKYGEIERVRVVRDKETGKSKGYAFILFEQEPPARAAYKEANGLKIKDRSILTDIERSRTFKSWVPRRLGGGLGGRGYIQRHKEAEKAAAKRRFEGPSLSSRGRGGARFGTRGGFDGGSRGGRGGRGGHERTRGPSRGGSSYDYRSSRYPSNPSGPYVRQPRPDAGYQSRSERPSSSTTQGPSGYESRSERPERTERYEYNSRSKREDRDFKDRDRDSNRDSKVHSDREKERERYRERKLEQTSKNSMGY